MREIETLDIGEISACFEVPQRPVSFDPETCEIREAGRPVERFPQAREYAKLRERLFSFHDSSGLAELLTDLGIVRIHRGRIVDSFEAVHQAQKKPSLGATTKRPSPYPGRRAHAGAIIATEDLKFEEVGWRSEHITERVWKFWRLFSDILETMLNSQPGGRTEKWKLLEKRYAGKLSEFNWNIDSFVHSLLGTPHFGGRLEWRRSGPTLVAYGLDPIQALVLSIHGDVLAGRSFRRCLWKKCNRLFETTAAREDKDYCSDECRHANKMYRRNQVLREQRLSWVKIAKKEWNKLPSSQRRSQDQSEWLADHAHRLSKGSFSYGPKWIRNNFRRR